MSFSCVEYSVLTVAGKPDFGGNTLSWLLLIVFLYWYLSIWVWGNYKYRGRFLRDSLLGGHLAPLFLFPLWSSGQSDLWSSRGCPPEFGAGFLMSRVASGQAECFC